MVPSLHVDTNNEGTKSETEGDKTEGGEIEEEEPLFGFAPPSYLASAARPSHWAVARGNSDSNE